MATRHPTLGGYDLPAFEHLAMAENELHTHLEVTTMSGENRDGAYAILDQAVVMMESLVARVWGS